MKCEEFPNREEAELKMLEWHNNAGINLTGYIFVDEKLVIFLHCGTF